MIDPAMFEHEMLDAVEKRHVRTDAEREVDVGFFCGFRPPGVDDHELRRIGSGSAVQHPHPHHRLLGSHIVADHEEGIRHINVGIRTRLAIRSKGFAQGVICRCRAEPRVAVHVRRSKTGLAHDRQRVIFLEKQLAARIERD